MPGHLTRQAKTEVERRMRESYPDATLPFLIPMSLDPIARELCGSAGA